ncbi:MAG: alkaline phosphatase [Bacillota bacterium]|nr:alkaline phosphatase [Bacillota bacterium]
MRKLSRLVLMMIALLSCSGFRFESLHTSRGIVEDRFSESAVLQSKPKNIIFMIGDGLGIGQMEIARLFEYGKEGRLFFQTLPHTGLVLTYSANNFVTDSAAAATALATGKKTNNGMIGITPDGKEADSILDLFKNDGKKTGIISTNTVTDATPAAFTASVQNRWAGQGEIARQQFENKIDVLLGGGASIFSPEHQKGIDLVQRFRQAGYSVATSREQLLSTKGDRILGLFHPSYMTFKQDREELGSQEPDLTEMTKKAIETLSKGKKGFFVMIEGARIDQSAHSGDIASIWKETIEFDEAVKYAVKWAEKQGDTLVVVTADHETMGISAPDPLNIGAYKNLKVTPEYMATKLIYNQREGQFTKESIKNVFYLYTGISLNEDEAQLLNDRIRASSGQVYASQRIAWEIGSLIAEKFNAGMISSKIRALSSTGGHTANMIPIFSYGPGSQSFVGVINNIEIPQKMAKLMGYHMQ